MHFITFYLKKYWFIPAFIIFAVIVVIVFLNIRKGEDYEKVDVKDNKVQIEGVEVEPNVPNKPQLAEITIGDTLVGKSLRGFVPSSIQDPERAEDYRRQLEADPYFPYKKTLNWYNHDLTQEDMSEVLELIVYHLMLHDQTSEYTLKFVNEEQLQEAGYEVTLDFDPETDYLILNLLVCKTVVETEEYFEYMQQFRLHYEGAYLLVE